MRLGSDIKDGVTVDDLSRGQGRPGKYIYALVIILDPSSIDKDRLPGGSLSLLALVMRYLIERLVWIRQQRAACSSNQCSL